MFRHIFGRSLLVQNDSGGNPEYAFLGDDLESGEVFVSGTQAEQNWMVGLYSLNDLYRYYQEWQDQAVTWHDSEIDADRSLQPSKVYAALVNSFKEYLPTACTAAVCSSGDGTWYGNWPNKVGIDFDGHRLDGTITSVYPVLDGDAVL